MTISPTKVADLPTPALIVDDRARHHNLTLMAAARPGLFLRPHVKAHKCTALAHVQLEYGHRSFTCATVREMIGMARAGLGDDLLLANECVDPSRLGDLARCQESARITVAVDSIETISAAVDAGIESVVIDVNVGLPRCGCDAKNAARLAEFALRKGRAVRGVMGYEGHLMALPDDLDKAQRVRESMAILVQAFTSVRDVAGDSCTVVSAGGTGTFHLFDDIGGVNEVQAGELRLDGFPLRRTRSALRAALHVLGTVISSQAKWAVIDVGLKSLGMDHGNPTIVDADVWFCSDEHTTFSVRHGAQPKVGEKILVIPAHVDPTVAMHETMYRVASASMDAMLLEEWAVDLRGWSTRDF